MRREFLHFQELLMAVGERAPSVADKLRMLEILRSQSPEQAQQVDQFLIEQLILQRSGLITAEQTLGELREMLDRLTNPPWVLATYLGAVATDDGPKAVVMHGGMRRVIDFDDDLDPDSLGRGDEVLLGRELNFVTGRYPGGPALHGEAAVVDRLTGDGRVVIRHRDEELVFELAAAMLGTALARGDRVRIDRSTWLVYEKLARTEGRHYLLDDVTTIGRDQIGGQDANLERLLSALTATLVDRARALVYGLSGRKSVLLIGPPGCGKTLMTRIAASEIARLSGKRCPIAVVKPAEWESPFVGESQANIRAFFDALKETAKDGFALAFLDEIEAVGRLRGSLGAHHSDKFLAALLAELDGFESRSNVAIIAATNRKDLVDPALLERLSDVEVYVRRPDLNGARAIFSIHLPADMPYHADGASPEATRDRMIETAVSLLYSPNAHNELCRIRFRDGRERTVKARELASGRTFEQICRAARSTAFLREQASAEQGMQVGDIERAVEDALQRLSTVLTPRNAAAYLDDLPQDVDVVSVEPIARRVSRPGRYIAAA